MPAGESLPAESGHRFENVDPSDAECIDCILQLTRCLAFRRFAFRPDQHERINDSMSVAWEFAQAGKGIPATVACFAIRRVASNGQFSRSRRSVDHNQAGRTARRKRNRVVASHNPATEACLKLDIQDWLSQLPERLERVARLLASGLNTVDVADEIGCTRGNISGIRQQLIANYQGFRNRA